MCYYKVRKNSLIVTLYSKSNVTYILFPWLRGKVSATQANRWRWSASSNRGNWVCVFFSLSFFSFLFSFFFLSTFSIFFHDQTYTLTQTTLLTEISSLHSICGLQLFDSRRSFSLEYDLTRSPYWKSLASPTSRSASFLYSLASR